MTEVIGLPKDLAVQRLIGEGYPVIVDTVRSRKGTDGCDERVVRQKMDESHMIHLTVSCFPTELKA